MCFSTALHMCMMIDEPACDQLFEEVLELINKVYSS